MNKELEVQKYLRSGYTLEDLQRVYAIKGNISECETLVNLKYNQLDSPKFERIVRECRGLVLRISDWSIVSQPFYRFLNFGEDQEITAEDVSKMDVLEKVDGSLCTLFYDPVKEDWRMSTSGTVDGLSNVNDYEITFQELFFNTLEKISPKWDDWVLRSYTYIFELTSPENRIVTPYKERSLTLLSARHCFTGEVSYNHLKDISRCSHIRAVEFFNLSTLNDIYSSFASIDPLDEGYVAVDYSNQDEYGNFKRVKIKNPSYVAKHQLKDSACNSRRALFGVVLTGEVSEIVSVFPEFEDKLLELAAKWDDWKVKHTDWIDDIRHHDYDFKYIGINTPDGIHKGLIFSIIKGKCDSIDDFVKQNIETRTFKSACKHILGMIEK